MTKLDRILQEALIKNNLFTEEAIKPHAILAKSESVPLKAYLLREKILTEKQILIALTQYLNLATIDFKSIKIDDEVIQKVPIKIASYYKILPICIEKGALTVASIAPLDVSTQDELRMHIGMDIDYVLLEESYLLEALKKYYGLASETLDRIIMKDDGSITAKKDYSDSWIEDLEKQTDDPTISHLVNEIILEAYHKRATDIHIEPYRNKVRLRYRIDGVLVDGNLPADAKHFLPQILSRIKILANLSITEKRLPQDGSAVVKTKEQHLDLRISTMPTPSGESIVIRILPTKVMLFSLERLGFSESDVNLFRKLIQKPHGIIFITGPTGSGKTTTLYACLNEISTSERKIITIEDPVEYEMEGITQVQVNPKLDFTFLVGLRSILRHDPDIIMLGEVRDPETAEIAIKTALTGHLVFSTLHTNDASSGITRLVDMGVESYLVASSVEAFVAQRLVRVLCPECKRIDEHPIAGIREEIVRALKISDMDSIQIHKAVGCDHCNQTGYYGRMAIYEILTMNDALRAAVLDKPRSDHIKRIAMREGLVTLRQNGWNAVIQGLTTPDEVLNATVKDDYLQEQASLSAAEEAPVSAHDTVSIIKDFQYKKSMASKKETYRERVYPRVDEKVSLEYTVVEENREDPSSLVPLSEVNKIQTENISAGGLRFFSDQTFNVGTLIDLSVSLPVRETPMKCLARVCRVLPKDGKEDYLIAVYFLDISSADRVSINRFIMDKLSEAKNIEV